MSGWYRPSQKLGKDKQDDSSWAYRDCSSTQPLAAHRSFNQLLQAWLKPGEAGDGWCHPWRTVSFVIYALPRHSETGTTPVSWSLLFPEGTQHAWNGFWKPLSSGRVQLILSASVQVTKAMANSRTEEEQLTWCCAPTWCVSPVWESDHVSDNVW